MPEVAAAVLQSLSELTPRGVWDWFLGTPLQIVVIIAFAIVLRWVLLRFIGRTVRLTLARADARRSREPGRASRVIAQATGSAHERHRQRTETMGSQVGINLAPMLATAGVGGVALGFGAQSLVKDFLSGIFMIFEDQYGVGDVIDTGEATGTVEEVSLRVTRLRDGTGVVWYIRNGEIVRIGNKSQGWATALVDIPVAYSENLERVLPLIRSVVHALDESPEWQDKLLEEPNVVGVESMTGTSVTIRVVAKTAPQEQYGVSREIRERVKAAFDEHGIKAPTFTPFGPPAR
jgi:moderate conductance mechanosensitive channel